MVGLIEQLTVVHDKSVEEVMEMLCNYMPPVMKKSCDGLIAQYGAIIIQMLGTPPHFITITVTIIVATATLFIISSVTTS